VSMPNLAVKLHRRAMDFRLWIVMKRYLRTAVRICSGLPSLF